MNDLAASAVPVSDVHTGRAPPGQVPRARPLSSECAPQLVHVGTQKRMSPLFARRARDNHYQRTSPLDWTWPAPGQTCIVNPHRPVVQVGLGVPRLQGSSHQPEEGPVGKTKLRIRETSARTREEAQEGREGRAQVAAVFAGARHAAITGHQGSIGGSKD